MLEKAVQALRQRNRGFVTSMPNWDAESLRTLVRELISLIAWASPWSGPSVTERRWIYIRPSRTDFARDEAMKDCSAHLRQPQARAGSISRGSDALRHGPHSESWPHSGQAQSSTSV